MRQRCRRCNGKRTIKVYVDPDGASRRVVCAVCKGAGKEWRKVYPPQPSRHFPADEARILRETAAMLKEAEDVEWFRTCEASVRRDRIGEVPGEPDEHTNGADEVPRVTNGAD